MDLSIVIPLFNEEESLRELAVWIEKVCNENKINFEALLIDDGSDDDSWKVIQSISKSNPAFKGIRFRRNYGKSAALNEGFQMAAGDIVITMDADLQDSPDEIPGLMQKIKEENFDLVSGWKQKRYDPITKTIPSKLYNATARIMFGIPLHDFNCGLKAYKNEVVKNVEVYGEMHRYVPVLAKRNGFAKIGEQVVQHRARQFGVTKFGLERFVNGFLDLLSIFFISKFGRRPMHFFGSIGTLFFMGGGLVTIYLILKKLRSLAQDLPFREVTDQPIFYLALVAIILGVQLFLAGFMAEMISRNNPERNDYQVSERLGL